MPQEPRQRDGCRFTAQNITAAQEKNPFAKISDIVYELLEKAIFSSAIPPGSKLNISKLAEQMGVSTSPVTRAVERLEENGLVTAVRSSDSKYRSYFVFDLSGESLEDLFVARRAIEGEAAFLCAQKRTLIDLPGSKSWQTSSRPPGRTLRRTWAPLPLSPSGPRSTWSSTTSWC